jgi:undecaprenyl-diphosphatase
MGKNKTAEPLLEIDRRARKLFKPYRKSLPVKAIDAIGDIGDQNPLRLVCLGLFGLGLMRRDARMMRAGARMLLAHELATLAKDAVKRRVDRTRPRRASKTPKPKKGRHTGKEVTSFPSGHSAGSMAVACAFAAEYPEHRGAALGAAGALGLAQIPTCAHYPSDVAAGMAIGAATEGVVGLAWRLVEDRLAKSSGA